MSQQLKHHLLKLLGHGIYIAVSTAASTMAVYAFLVFYNLAFRFTVSIAQVAALVAGAFVFFALYDHVAHDVRKSIKFVKNHRIAKYFARNAPSYISGTFGVCLTTILLLSSGDQINLFKAPRMPQTSEATAKTDVSISNLNSSGRSESSKIVETRPKSEPLVTVPSIKIDAPKVTVLVPMPRPRNVICEFDSEQINSQEQMTKRELAVKVAACKKELAKRPPKTGIGGP